jgi:hypothetical protein
MIFFKRIRSLAYISGIAYTLFGVFIHAPKKSPSIVFLSIGVLILSLIVISEIVIRNKNDIENR